MTDKKPEISPDRELALLRLIAAGDQHAFRRLVDIFWKRVYGNTLTLVKSPEMAGEITQDIFLKIWQQRESLSQVRSFKQYIYVVGRNKVISEMRKKIVGVSAGPEDILDERLAPDRQLLYKETYALIMEGVEKLTLQQQRIFKMSRLTGLTYEEIATELGLSKNTVKGHMVLALNYLRTYLKDHAGISVVGFLLAQFMLRK